MNEAQAKATRDNLLRSEPYSVSADEAVKVYSFLLERAREADYRSVTRWLLREAAHHALRMGGFRRVDEFRITNRAALPEGALDLPGRIPSWARAVGDGLPPPWLPNPIPGLSFRHTLEWLPRQ